MYWIVESCLGERMGAPFFDVGVKPQTLLINPETNTIAIFEESCGAKTVFSPSKLFRELLRLYGLAYDGGTPKADWVEAVYEAAREAARKAAAAGRPDLAKAWGELMAVLKTLLDLA